MVRKSRRFIGIFWPVGDEFQPPVIIWSLKIYIDVEKNSYAQDVC